MTTPTEGFLTAYERDTLILEQHTSMGELMRHFGLDASGRAYEVNFDKVRQRQMAREHPDPYCSRHQCHEDATYHDFEVWNDGKGYCDEHRPQPSEGV